MSGDSLAGQNGAPPDDSSANGMPYPLDQDVMDTHVRPLAIAAMLACIALSMAQFINRIWPGFPSGLAILLVFLLSLESIHAHRLLTKHEVDRQDRLRFRFVEWIIILLIARLAPYIHLGAARLARDLDMWTTDFGHFFGIDFVLLAALLGAFWGTALVLARSIDELAASPLEEKLSSRDPEYYLRSTMPQHGQVNRQMVLDRIITVFYAGGAVLLLFAGFARIDVTEIAIFDLSPSSGVIINALVYFVLGFLLISQAQYTINRARWQIQGIPILDQIGRRWLVLVVSLLVTVALVSALLPVGYSVGILSVLSTIVAWIVFAIAQVFFFLLLLVSLLAGLLSRLLGLEFGDAMPQMGPVAPPPSPDPVDGAGWPWWSLVRSIIFWGVILAIVTYSLFYFARDRWGILGGVSLKRWFSALAALWRSLKGGGRRAWQSLSRTVQERLQLRREAEGAPWWRLNLRRLSDQERVRYYYLSVLHRTARQGFGRPPSATPLEYERRLAESLPETDKEIEALTQAFVEARYSAHEITPERVSAARRVWRAVRRALAVRRRASRDKEKESSR